MALQPQAELTTQPLQIKRALLSVSDKTGIQPLAKMLFEHNVELFSTGGTAAQIRAMGLPVKDVSEVTGFPECLDGRVKTLHPHVHGGILARTSHEPDVKELQTLGIEPFDLVVVNLYPFQQTVAEPDCTPAKAVEYIDIGGPTMIRAAAKNFAHVAILSNPNQYADFMSELAEEKTISFKHRRMLAAAAFSHTAEYDAHIAQYFSILEEELVPSSIHLSFPMAHTLRYGENPHQQAGVFGNPEEYIDCFHGKALSYNNYLDVDAALRLISDFEEETPTAAIFKHTVPCGVGTGTTLKEAYDRAFETDTVSPFGGIVIVNQPLDLEAAQAIDGIFTEIILAPSFGEEALRLLKKKNNRRLITIKRSLSNDPTPQLKSVFGGMLWQEADNAPMQTSEFKVVTEKQPSTKEWEDLIFAWKIVRHVKSNAIVFAHNGQTLGIGTGQTSRVDSSALAVWKAQKENLSLQGSAIASDAFFPFADGVQAAADAGATAVIQPGGSIRDEEVIDCANRLGLSMVFTGKRHFRH